MANPRRCWLQPAAGLAEPSIDGRVLAVACGLACGARSSLAPLGACLRSDLVALLGLAHSARARPSSSPGRGDRRPIVSAACSRARSAHPGDDPGFRAGVFSPSAPRRPPVSLESRTALAAYGRAAALPSVTVGAVGPPSTAPNCPTGSSSTPTSRASADYRTVSPSYFETAGVTLLSSRPSDDYGRAARGRRRRLLPLRPGPAHRRLEGGCASSGIQRVTPRGSRSWASSSRAIRPVAAGEQIYSLSQAFRNPSPTPCGRDPRGAAVAPS